MPKVFYKDLWGKREDKYKFLESNDVSTIHWQELNLTEPHYFFVPKDFSLEKEYNRFWSVKDRKLSLDEIQRYLKIIFSISSTLEIQKEIDKIITRED